MARRHSLAMILLLLCGGASAQEARMLEPERVEEREIAGGETHLYRVALRAGQFVQFRLEQRAIDTGMMLVSPEGKSLAVRNQTRAGAEEALSIEAAAGEYRLQVRAAGSGTLRGGYRLRMTLRETATADDKKRLAAEALLIEVLDLSRSQAPKTAPQLIEKADQGMTLWRELGDLVMVGRLMTYRGSAYSSLNRADKAIESINGGLKLVREQGDRAAEAEALSSLASAYGSISRTEEAAENFGRALAIYRELQDRPGQGSMLSNLGVAQNFLSRYDKAIESFEQALPLSREAGNRFSEGRISNGLGLANFRLGRYELSIEYYDRALALSREAKDRLGEGNTLMTLGNTYAILQRGERAVEYYEQALAIFRETKYRVGEGNTLLGLGVAYSALEETQKSISYYEQALAIFREVKFRNGEGSVLFNLARLSDKAGQYEKALAYLDQALALGREIKDRRIQATVLGKRGLALQQLKRNDEALASLDEALRISREIGDRTSEGQALVYFAMLERDRGNGGRAQELAEESMRIAESLRTDIQGADSRAALFTSTQSLYQFFAELLMREHQRDPGKGLDARAVEISERQRARSLLDLLAEARVNVRQGVEPALLERERALSDQLNDKAKNLAQAGTPEQAAALKREITRLEGEHERARAAIQKSSPRYAALAQPQPLGLKEIQTELDPDTLLLEFAMGTERSYLWAITKDSLASHELPKADEIQRSARDIYERLTARSEIRRNESPAERGARIAQAEAGLPAAARALSQTLLAPVAGQLGRKRLVIVADGALQYVPFGMLPEPAAGKRASVARPPLIVNHEVVNLPSASALAIQRAETAGRPPAPGLLAVVADPVFDRTDDRLRAALAAEPADGAAPQHLALNSRSVEQLAEKGGAKTGVAARKLVIPRLPFTRQEADQLLTLAPAASSFQAIGFQASRETVLGGALSGYRYVHFATHGVLDSERPGLSSLVLSMVDEKGRQRNGFLRANDIYNLRLPADLVVLSACQTGLGKEIKGEGLVGLTRGFMYAGAARVVVSLWSVNDQATADLMARFYRKMLQQGERPAAALRAAQVEMWRQKQWQAPYYWAAFILQGDWR